MIFKQLVQTVTEPLILLNISLKFEKKMGSSNCKSFSPSKISAAANIQKVQDEYVEGIVCKETDLKENEMKSFDLGDSKVLVVKQNGVFSALGNKCTHYGAPLSGGALGHGRVRCQWHGACFNLKTGDIEDFPGLDSLPCYQVSIQNGDVHVKAKKSELETSKRIKTMAKRDPNNHDIFLIVGGGPSGATCAETLRQEGFTGEIIFSSKEKWLPYDRVKVSKQMDFDIDSAQFRTPEFYRDNDITFVNERIATCLNGRARVMFFSTTGDTVKFTKCYIATGSTPAIPNIPGSKLKNIFTLRNYEDAKAVLEQIKPERHVVILGSSFIALEAAAYLVNKVAKVSVVGRGAVPLKSVFGEAIGARLKTLFEEKGVHMIMNSGITKFNETNGAVSSVELKDESTIQADFCILGVGSTLNTGFLKSSGIDMNSDGSINVNSYMETSIEDVYAGGDIANAPVFSSNNQRAVIGHYPLAHYHGRIAALNMLGKRTESKAVPFFWTMLFGKSIRYVGHGVPDDLLINGSLDDLKYLAIFFKGDKVIAMASCQRDPLCAKYAELLSQGRQLTKAEILKDPLGWAK